MGAKLPAEVVGAQRGRALVEFVGAIRRLGEREAVTKKGWPTDAVTELSTYLQAVMRWPT